jgi:hypothetical protein
MLKYNTMVRGVEKLKNKYQSEQPLGIEVKGGLWWTLQGTFWLHKRLKICVAERLLASQKESCFTEVVLQDSLRTSTLEALS